MASSMDEDSNSEAKNHNINPVGFAELEAASFRFDRLVREIKKRNHQFSNSSSAA